MLGTAVQSLICARVVEGEMIRFYLKKTIEINMPWTDENNLLKVWFPFIWSKVSRSHNAQFFSKVQL